MPTGNQIVSVVSMNSKINHQRPKNNILGETPDEKLVNHFSNELEVNENTPPAFLVHALDDKASPN